MKTRDISNQTPGDFPKIPGYKIKKRLGKGGMAQVYLAFQEDLEREVAIKVLDPIFLRDEKILKRFKYEAKTAAKLVHNNIVTIYNVGHSENNHYIVMEYLKESLRNRLDRLGKLSIVESLVTIKKIADALFYAHDKGIIHRDIKPDNIMFRADGTPVLVDFGIARIVDLNTHLTMTGVRIGTPYYMSPEQCIGEKLDGRSDIYALGVVLYELITGDVPYKSETPSGLIYLHIQGCLPKLTGSLSEYQPLIDKMMAKGKQERIENGQELIKLIQSFEKDQLPVEQNDSRILRESISKLNHQKDSSTEYLSLTQPTTAPPKKRWAWSLGMLITVIIGLMLYFFIPILLKDDQPTSNHQVDKNVTEKEELHQEKSQPPSSLQSNKEIKTQADPKKPTPKIRDTGKTKPPEKVKIEIPKKKKKYEEKVKAKKDEVQEKETREKNEDIIETTKRKVKIVNIADLSREMVAKIDKELTRIEVWSLPEGIVVGGKIKFDLLVNENGNIRIKRFDDTLLSVTPPDKKEIVKNMISTKINSLAIFPPKDESGQPINIENWLKTFDLYTFSGKIILY